MHWLIGIPATFFLTKNTIYIKLATTLQVGPQKKTMLHPSPSTQSVSGSEAAKSPVTKTIDPPAEGSRDASGVYTQVEGPRSVG
jgi:hypothetical protein